MGTWGTGITQDDTTADVIGFVVDRMKAGDSLEAASGAAEKHFAELAGDKDEAPLLWLGLAEVQWKYGRANPAVLARVRDDVEHQRGLERWGEDQKLLVARQAALAKFLAKVEVEDPKTSKPPKRVTRNAPFAPGDCLAVMLPNGRYTAALVLKADNSRPECGMNLVGTLDYCEDALPDLKVFEQRKWLKLTHGQWKGRKDLCWYQPVGLREAKKNITVVGCVPVRWLDPKDSSLHTAWPLLGQHIRRSRESS